ncbi:MAG TPA: hypothetical protein VHS31_00435 [Tepidisphaeraceae bacterium]|nr:hypothetical protein [Tepidisphaeraceae bacterium]
MFASCIPRPRDVTLRWLRLCGIIAITMAGLAIFFWTRRGIFDHLELAFFSAAIVLIAMQLTFVQTSKPVLARFPALLSFLVSLPLAVRLLSTPTNVPYGAVIVGCAGVATMTGLVLMEMLLGHAYLTAAKMTISPFQRMNFTFAGVLGLRMFFALCAILMQPRWPIELFWPREGLLVGTRWLVGLLLPCVFVYMTHDCIKRRSTQSATGILYVTGVVIFIGEMIALYLTRETGLPF